MGNTNVVSELAIVRAGLLNSSEIFLITSRRPRSLDLVGDCSRLAQTFDTGGVDAGGNPGRGYAGHGQEIRGTRLQCLC